MAKKVGNIQLFMGPQQVGAPDDLESIIVEFIDGAKRRLDIAIQELESRPIAEAIIRARQRRCVVRLVTESDYLSVTRAVANPWDAGGVNETNRVIHNAILRAKINAKTDFNNDIFHQKFIIRDRSSLLTGSTNFTPSGVQKNLNHVVIVHDRRIANTYSREFGEIQQGHFGKLNEGHDEAPRDLLISNIPVKVLFAPDHSPEMEIMKQMAKSTRSVDFAIFTFAKSSGIDDQMIALKRRGIKVSGALDAGQGNQRWAATRPIKNAGAKLHLVKKGNGVGKLHHKLMVLDEQVIILGSFNYTRSANRLNDENILIIGDLDSKNKRSINAQKRLAGYAKTEIDRIMKDHGKRLR